MPSAFVGQHFHAPLATPDYEIGLWRSHDGPSMQWRDAHLGPGRFDWSTHDAAIAHYNALGLPCNYCLYGTPAWASSRPWKPDPYNHFGANAAPSSTEAAEEFTRALLTRYRGRIRWLEVWNEFNNTAGAVFWTGSMSELARLARSVYRAAKTTDPSVVVLAPSVTSDDQSLTRFLSADDGDGGAGARWLDGIALHPYRAYGWSEKGRTPDLELGRWVDEIRKRLADGRRAVSTPIYVTEIGYHWAPDDPSIIGRSPESFADWIEGVVLRAATLGLQQIDLYSHTSKLLGEPSRHALVAQAIDRVSRGLSGQTLHRVSRLPDRRYRVRTSAGEFFLAGRL